MRKMLCLMGFHGREFKGWGDDLPNGYVRYHALWFCPYCGKEHSHKTDIS